MFEDDDVGPDRDAYRKALKSRKWLVLSAAVLSAVSLGLYKGLPANTAIILLPSYLVFKAALGTTAFLSIQFGIQLAQVFTVYRSLLENRLFANHQSELKNLGNELFGLEEERQGLAVQLAHQNTGPSDKVDLMRKERFVLRQINLTKDQLRQSEMADPRHNRTFTMLEVAADWLKVAPAVGLAALSLALAIGSEHWITLVRDAGFAPPSTSAATGVSR
jgi:hypothetical protein